MLQRGRLVEGGVGLGTRQCPVALLSPGASPTSAVTAAGYCYCSEGGFASGDAAVPVSGSGADASHRLGERSSRRVPPALQSSVAAFGGSASSCGTSRAAAAAAGATGSRREASQGLRCEHCGGLMQGGGCYEEVSATPVPMPRMPQELAAPPCLPVTPQGSAPATWTGLVAFPSSSSGAIATFQHGPGWPSVSHGTSPAPVRGVAATAVTEEPSRRPSVIRRRPPGIMDVTTAGPEASPERSVLSGRSVGGAGVGLIRQRSLIIATPSSCSSVTYRNAITPGTPDPLRGELMLVTGDVGVVLFDFDGTLTASSGDTAVRCRKEADLIERTPMLAPRLRALRDASLTLGIISKSSDRTIQSAVREAGLKELFDGPVMGSAVGLEGKAGFIEELVRTGSLRHLGPDGLRRVLLVDDDVRELDRARQRGIQTYAAPKEGGLQEEDFDQIFTYLGLGAAASHASSKPMPPRSFSSCPCHRCPHHHRSPRRVVVGGARCCRPGASDRSLQAHGRPPGLFCRRRRQQQQLLRQSSRRLRRRPLCLRHLHPWRLRRRDGSRADSENRCECVSVCVCVCAIVFASL
mmetsp:Transcript_36416/g.116826  ORF Transcript_36416/g.116826 Transcript_36416/m.116826 type:complete len:579 (-) Transcript_36416:65-1801(-)